MKRAIAAAAGAAAVLMFGAETKGPPAKPPASSGAEMYRSYCASCHGADGKGGGPVARALKMPPTDLTTLARRNSGRFPEMRVYQTVEGNDGVVAHGSRAMPVWGSAFRRMGGTDEATVKLRVRNLTRFLESLQAK